MSEPEIQLYGVLSAWGSNVIMLLALQLIVLGSYLITAQRVGTLLSNQQVFILTCCLLFFSFVLTAYIYSSLQVMIDVRELALFGYTTLRNAALFKWIVSLGCLIAPLACISFMLHARRPRRQDDKRLPQGNRRERGY